ncbi:MAG: nitrate reductase [Omnitrophica WOR_2 bacterium RIFCSPHIGHO2_01_FULL_48_9]|nr:MAG: nitrate reductase [Omnitrophica WOR_2 bacterium RIFCSPHIGHO2_01_FULL_48_9]
MINDVMSRQEFLKLSAKMAALAALGLGGGVSFLEQVANAADDKSRGLKWHKAPCRFCGVGCGALVGVRDGKVVAVQGDRQAPVNKGLLCVKGYHAGAALYGKDRLTHPLIRKNGQLQRASWEEAIDLIAGKIAKDSKRFAVYGSGQWTITEGYTAMKFLKGGLRHNHIDPNARLCMASAVVGFLTTFGADEPSGCYDDLDVCDTVVCWGNNWAEMHPVLFSRFIDRRQRGDKIKMIDMATRRTRTTEAADHYIEFQPQTDMLIANGICHLLIKREAYDKEFVAKNVRFKTNDEKVITIDDYKAFLEEYTPEKVTQLSGISLEQLNLLAGLFSDPKEKVVSLWCMGMNQHTRGTAINNLVYNVHLLSGKIGKPGSTPFSLTGQPSACGTCREVGTLAHALPGGRLVKNEEDRRETEKNWNLPEGALDPEPGLHTVAMFKAFVTGELTGMWVQVTNPGQSLPDLNANFKKKDQFLVVSDVYPTATTKLADVVLPSAMWVEKNGLFGNSERRTQQWFKMIDPPGEARDDVWQMIAVARRLYEKGFEGMKDKDGNFLLSIRDEGGTEIKAWRWDAFRSNNIDKPLFEDYRKFTAKKHKDLAPYDEYVKHCGLRWPVVQDAFGRWQETTRRYVEGEDPFVKQGEGVSFYMDKGGENRANIWARPYEPPPEVPDNDYPFWLCTGRVLEHWHTATMTRRIKELYNANPWAYVELNPKDARELSISHGDKLRVVSRRGSVILPVSINGRSIPQEGSVFVPFFDEDALINLVTLDAFCPLSKQPDYKKCAVRLEKV